MSIKAISNLFKSILDVSVINSYSNVKLRNNKTGIPLTDAVFFRMSYSQVNKTQQNILSKLNMLKLEQNPNNKIYTRQGLKYKEANIPLQTYKVLYDNLASLYNEYFVESSLANLVAVDGTYNNNRMHEVTLNLGLFDINNNIPIDLCHIGAKDRNNEVRSFINILKSDPDKYKDMIFVCDRLYYNFALIKFFQDNGFKFIIRAKKDAKGFDCSTTLKKSVNYSFFQQQRSKTRVIKCFYDKAMTVSISKSKKKTDTANITIKSDCVFITNLLDDVKYTDTNIIDFYKSRWDIEVFFKHHYFYC
jgi:Transposase DDE domain